MTSPYDAHVGAVDQLKGELETLSQQIRACVERCETDVANLTRAAAGDAGGPGDAIWGAIGRAKDSLDDAIGSVVAAGEAADSYASTWSGGR